MFSSSPQVCVNTAHQAGDPRPFSYADVVFPTNSMLTDERSRVLARMAQDAAERTYAGCFDVPLTADIPSRREWSKAEDRRNAVLSLPY